MITKNNYEAFFLDYHEASLSEELKKEVLAFVDSNPGLKREFESFEMISLNVKPSIKFPGKDKLKKNTITEYNYKTWFVAYEENDLGEEDRKQVEQFIEINPGYNTELEILKRTKILPDHAIRFANKSSLKKGGLVIPLWVRVAAAACLVIGLLGYWMIQQKPKQEMATDHKLPNAAPVLSNEKATPEKIPVIAGSGNEVIERNIFDKKIQKPAMKLFIENKSEENLAKLDSIPVIQNKNNLIDQPLAFQPHLGSDETNSGQQTTIIINENQPQNARDLQKLVVLDDNDLSELGLNEKKAEENKSLVADAVNGVGKIFGVNAHYERTHKPLQSKYKETIALGPVAITRTVLRY